MITIVKPKDHIYSLWGGQTISSDQRYRLMKYVFQYRFSDHIILHNMVTGHLIMLESKEIDILHNLPSLFRPAMEQLIINHFLVLEDFNEHEYVAKLRKILFYLLDSQKSNIINYYTILPTTACNARCWYCFEKGVVPYTMSKETADDVVKFIVSHCGGKPVTIRWFGGEPTLAVQRIDQICNGLNEKQVEFSSIITTNGYLLDKNTIEKSKNLWKLKMVTISVDGTEKNYNRVKSFVNASDNPYQKVLRNIGLFLDQEIHVGLRMNFDQDTFSDFYNLVDEMSNRFKKNPFLHVYAHHINVDYSGEDQVSIDKAESWYNEKLFELNSFSCECGLYERKRELPSLFFKMCEAANDDAVTITSLGHLVSCAEQIDEDQIKGDLKNGITNAEIVKSWKQFSDNKKCWDCVFYPSCAHMLRCKGNGRCYRKTERFASLEEEINKNLINYLNLYNKEVFK